MTAPLVVLVTGASSGIGRAAALRLARSGHRVLAAGRRPEALTALAGEAPAGRVEPVGLDVTDAASVRRCQAEVDRRTDGAGPDVLVNNAGYALPGPLEVLTDADLRALFDTNVFGLLAVTRAFLPKMRERRAGRVVNVGSLMGRYTMPLLGAYNASKHAVRALTDALRMELGPFGLEVVLVEPGAVRTGFRDRALHELDAYLDPGSPYAAALTNSRTVWDLTFWMAVGPETVARTIERAATAARPAARYAVPARDRLLLGALAALPTPAADAAKRLVMGWPPRARARPGWPRSGSRS